MTSYFICLGHYATFKGRATRVEFWGYTIVNSILIAALAYFYLNAAQEQQTLATVLFFMYVLLRKYFHVCFAYDMPVTCCNVKTLARYRQNRKMAVP